LVSQIAGLERRTRSGGKDVIDHPPGGHDELANAVAGAADAVGRIRRIGGMRLPRTSLQGETIGPSPACRSGRVPRSA
jgi:hypothetical protein